MKLWTEAELVNLENVVQKLRSEVRIPEAIRYCEVLDKALRGIRAMMEKTSEIQAEFVKHVGADLKQVNLELDQLIEDQNDRSRRANSL